MKFTKFVKSLASEGVIYETNQILEKRWLASVSVLMAIPDTVRSVTASDIKEAPETIKRIINGIGNTVDATLEKAVMPIADGKIKDCVRVYQSEDGSISLSRFAMMTTVSSRSRTSPRFCTTMKTIPPFPMRCSSRKPE